MKRRRRVSILYRMQRDHTEDGAETAGKPLTPNWKNLYR